MITILVSTAIEDNYNDNNKDNYNNNSSENYNDNYIRIQFNGW